MAEEEAGESVGLWYVSFSDMITLLLSFFVILCGFSSFDEESREKFSGVMNGIARFSVFGNAQNVHDSIVPPHDASADTAEDGSEKPVDPVGVGAHKPKKLPWVAELDAYKDRRVFYIPIRSVFWGKSNSLTPEGRESLVQIAAFVSRVGCQVTLTEILPEGGAPAFNSMDRLCSVQEFLIVKGKLSGETVNISSTTALPPNLSKRPAEPTLEICLISRSKSR
jgi:hypothetical protein